MRWKALLLVTMLIMSGCISGSSGTGEENSSQAEAINTSTADNSTSKNASENATYLKNEDYNETHIHDYWPGNTTEKILMDETVSTNPFVSVFYTTFSPFFQDPKTGVGITWFSLPNGSFVPQGTGKLIVEVDATGALKRGQQALSYRPANAATYTEMDPKGAKAAWEIEVTPEMTDLAHAKSTQWAYMLEAKGPGSVLEGEINVKITAQKTRGLTALPEHPDFWDKGHKTKLHLETMNATFDEIETFADEFRETSPEDPPLNFTEGTIVPPETKVLLVKFWFARDDDPKNNLNADVNLRAKEGSSSAWYGWQEHRVVQEREGYKMYAIPVDGSNWDSPYAEKSTWSFMIEEPSGVYNPATEDRYYFSVGEIGSGNVTVDATAYRVVPPWLDQMMAEEDIGDDRSVRDR